MGEIIECIGCKNDIYVDELDTPTKCTECGMTVKVWLELNWEEADEPSDKRKLTRFKFVEVHSAFQLLTAIAINYGLGYEWNSIPISEIKYQSASNAAMRKQRYAQFALPIDLTGRNLSTREN